MGSSTGKRSERGVAAVLCTRHGRAYQAQIPVRMVVIPLFLNPLSFQTQTTRPDLRRRGQKA